MWRTMAVSAGATALLCVIAAPVGAQELRPITELPKDLAHLATAWVALPQTMYAVARDEGPLRGMTVGTMEGSSVMVEDTVTYLTSGYHDPARPNERRPAGALLHYSF